MSEFTAIVLAAMVPVLLGFIGVIYSYGRLVSKVDALEQKIASLEKLILAREGE